MNVEGTDRCLYERNYDSISLAILSKSTKTCGQSRLLAEIHNRALSYRRLEPNYCGYTLTLGQGKKQHQAVPIHVVLNMTQRDFLKI